ncbi:hypothetical protein [Micromonospora sp. KC723]|uniref:hypothetical protein n=1 Tax=Micromonospora sp. KC723 TaxID=2530381 RepID=UPI00104C8CCB|nr:hypothetical protein [Micromonospora sp. KC723]TDB76951.1 hypothetical protein E1165_05245 [Micromonospora sp. KC723]
MPMECGASHAALVASQRDADALLAGPVGEAAHEYGGEVTSMKVEKLTVQAVRASVHTSNHATLRNASVAWRKR